MDLRATLDRLNPIQICNSGVGENELSCELEQRVFFSVDISDGDLRTTVSNVMNTFVWTYFSIFLH